MAREKGYFEKDFEDRVYDEDYYGDNYAEELADDDLDEDFEDEEEDEKEKDSEDDDEETEGRRVHLIFACEDCDYRWDDYVVSYGDSLSESEDYDDVACPMCGSANVEQI